MLSTLGKAWLPRFLSKFCCHLPWGCCAHGWVSGESKAVLGQGKMMIWEGWADARLPVLKYPFLSLLSHVLLSSPQMEPYVGINFVLVVASSSGALNLFGKLIEAAVPYLRSYLELWNQVHKSWQISQVAPVARVLQNCWETNLKLPLPTLEASASLALRF